MAGYRRSVACARPDTVRCCTIRLHGRNRNFLAFIDERFGNGCHHLFTEPVQEAERTGYPATYFLGDGADCAFYLTEATCKDAYRDGARDGRRGACRRVTIPAVADSGGSGYRLRRGGAGFTANSAASATGIR